MKEKTNNYPNWHKYPDEKPPFQKEYIIAVGYEDGAYVTSSVYYDGEFWDCEGISPAVINDVIAWTELPEFNIETVCEKGGKK